MHGDPSLLIDDSLEPTPVRVALIWAAGMPGCPPTEAPFEYLREVLDRARAEGPDFIPADRRAAVRSMLRHGAYRPAGRSKPSSEYLLAAALSGAFPLVNGPVDVNNLVSLESGYPASIFDAARSGGELLLRRGRPGESYAFNPSGQEIDLEDLLVTCRRADDGWVPCGNPVKDSMATKVRADTTAVIAVVYAPAGESIGELRKAAERFRNLLLRHCAAATAAFSLVPEDGPEPART